MRIPYKGAVAVLTFGACLCLLADGPAAPARSGERPAPPPEPTGPLEPLRPVEGRPTGQVKRPADTADFNGDGHRDTVLGSAAHGRGAFVAVIYGGPSGHSGSRQVLGPSTPGMPGRITAFSAQTASADFDRDGYADLLTLASADPTGDPSAPDAFVIFYGSPTGLSGRSLRLDLQGTRRPGPPVIGDFDGNGIPDPALADREELVVFPNVATRPVEPVTRRYGTSHTDDGGVIEAADVNGDGRTDLVLLVTDVFRPDDEDAEEGDEKRIEMAHLFLGTSRGLARNSTVIARDRISSHHRPVIADVNGDGRDDVTFVARDGDGPVNGFLTVRGTAHGLGPSQRIPDSTSDRYGTDGQAIWILPGRAGGFSAGGAWHLTNRSSGLPTPGHILSAFSLTDVTGDEKADLNIWTKTPGHAALVTLYGSPSGVTASGATALTRTDLQMTDRRLDFPTSWEGLEHTHDSDQLLG